MNVLVAGASGFAGQAVVAALRRAGHLVHRLVRRPIAAADEITWHPDAREIDPTAIAAVDAIVNLAGENIAAKRWTAGRRDVLRASRIDATRTLADALARVPRHRVLVNASATGFYGNRGDEVLDESSAAGAGFLAELCRDWETAALAAERTSARVVCFRFGVVLGPGGALAKMLPAFRIGVGGTLGSGSQWMSWIHLDDVVAAVESALVDDRYCGPINLVAPAPTTNREFTCALATVLGRPAWLPVPAPVLRLALGRMADEALLASARVAPARLRALGFEYKLGVLEDALRAAVTPR